MERQYNRNKIAERQVKFKINKFIEYYVKKCGKLEIKKVEHFCKSKNINSVLDLNVLELKAIFNSLKNKIVMSSYNQVWTLHGFKEYCKKENIQDKIEEFKRQALEFGILEPDSIWFNVIYDNKEMEISNENIRIIDHYFNNLMSKYLVATDSDIPYIDLRNECGMNNKYIAEYIKIIINDDKFDEHFSLSDSLFMMQKSLGVLITGGTF